MAMAERQSAHRIELETQVVTADIKRSYWGLAAAFVIAIAFLGVAYKLVDTGHDWAGVALAGTTLVSLVGTFIYGTVVRSNERQKRVHEMTGTE